MTPEFERVAASFERQRVMASLGATLCEAGPGEVTLAMRHDAAYTQQHGFLHAGIVATVLDSACGYAAYTLMPEGAGVLSVEFKLNMLRPAQGERFRFVGKVVKAGRTISVCEGQAYGYFGSVEKLVATMSCTLMTIEGREGITD